MKRLFDIFTSLLLLTLLSPLILFISLAILITSKGSVLFWSKRVGKNSSLFSMPKFRTMSTSAPIVATHLLKSSDTFLTPIGSHLRKASLDEIPQLLSVIIGHMSLVGPRPALYNQDDLIQLRKKHLVDTLLPGITGWAQINGRDEISIEEKVKLDLEYLNRKTFAFDLKILVKTFIKVTFQKDISH